MGTVFSLSKKKRIAVKSDGKCWYCGCELVATPHHPAELTLDHFEPKSRGGKNNDENLVFACRRCNNKKWGRNLEEYRYFRAFSTDHHKARKALGEALHLLPIAQAIAIAEVIDWIESQESEIVFYGESLTPNERGGTHEL